MKNIAEESYYKCTVFSEAIPKSFSENRVESPKQNPAVVLFQLPKRVANPLMRPKLIQVHSTRVS